jgi:hypothetical protein
VTPGFNRAITCCAELVCERTQTSTDGSIDRPWKSGGATPMIDHEASTVDGQRTAKHVHDCHRIDCAKVQH